MDLDRLEALLAKRAAVKAAGESGNFMATIEACDAFNSAAMDFMRDHGPALLQLARAVQSAPYGMLATYPEANDRATFLYFNGKGDVQVGQTVALVPVPTTEGK